MIMNSEVLIYVQTMKSYFENNQEARAYILGDVDEELFFDYLIEISNQNFENTGDPRLNRGQFESLRIALLLLGSKNIDGVNFTDQQKNLFVEIPNMGEYCLN